MTKRFLIAFLALGLSLHITGCSSSSSKEDSEVAEANDEAFAEESDGDFAEAPAEDGEATETADAAAPEEGGDDLALDGGAESTTADAAAPAEGGDDLSLDGEGGGAVADAGAEAGADAGAAAPPAEGGGGDELALDDSLPEDVGGGAPEAPPSPENPEPPAVADAPPTDEPLFANEPPLQDPPPQEPPSQEPAPGSAEGSTDVASAGADAGGGDAGSVPVAAPASFAPLQKIKDAPFSKAGANLNRVYIARPGDTAKSVSKKIYGSNRSKDLVSWNPILKRGMKAGDKIYYSSPSQPDDSRMLTYFEETNRPPSTYVSQEGDNLRKVSKKLLGYGDAWKEVWATNLQVESKGDIPAGTELKYWPDDGGSSAPSIPIASAPPPEVPADPGMPAGPDPLDPPPPMDQAATDPTQNVASNGPASDPLAAPPPPDAPPPPPPVAGGVNDPLAAPPPPPPPIEAPKEPKPVARKMSPSEESMGDPDNMMAMVFAGILIVAVVVLFAVIRKNRAKRMDLGQTQV